MSSQVKELSPAKSAFEFGENWSRFLASIDAGRVTEAERSLRELLGVTDLAGKSFLDAGSGSGLFSLAAWRLGGTVVSFDEDPKSVACTQALRSHWLTETQSTCGAADEPRWTIVRGSLLDPDFLSSVGQCDVVYCWGVAHHTGAMWQALENLVRCVAEGGLVAVAIYNDQLYISRGWQTVKRLYQRIPRPLRPVFVAMVGAVTSFKRVLVTLLAFVWRMGSLRNPFVPVLNWFDQRRERGMHAWHDLVDWVGGWPFEVARPEQVFRFFRDRGFTLREMRTSVGHGCNEFVFRKDDLPCLHSDD